MTEVITRDSLEIGDKYPSESKLCEQFEVSRTAVRARAREGNGLLDAVHGKGRTVRALPAAPRSRSLGSHGN
ncbi:GntR family transcriptional regulator [Streptomyces sp. NPDC056463]|uniref:GntR family transcriptional regulator n=1 Tax=Streptomyces sp. NPDC056463 TaxID=3345827 RepID=UPI003689F272